MFASSRTITSVEYFVVAETPTEAFEWLKVSVPFATLEATNEFLNGRCLPGSVRPKIMRVVISTVTE